MRELARVGGQPFAGDGVRRSSYGRRQRGLTRGPDRRDHRDDRCEFHRCGGGHATDNARAAASRDAAASRNAAAGARACPSARTRTGGAAKAEKQANLRERARWRERSKLLVQSAQLAVVGATRTTLANVAPGVPTHPHSAVGSAGELVADVLARRVPRHLEVDESGTGAQQQRLHRRHGDSERVRKLAVAEALKLAHQQDRALRRRQRLNVGDQPRERLTTLGNRRWLLRLRCR